MTDLGARRRIAILGGGAGSMAAAWALTSLPDAQNRFDITVYQMGWRLGGKGASGRNAQYHDRIEEHGLHIWAGFYQNAFKMMRELYAALPADGRLFTRWDQAFLPHSLVALQENVDGEWIPWPIDLEQFGGEVPGVGGELPTPWQYFKRILDLLQQHVEKAAVLPKTDQAHTPPPGLFLRLEQHLVESLAGHIRRDAHALLGAASRLAEQLPDDVATHSADHHQALLWMLREAVRVGGDVLGALGRRNNDARRLHDILSLGGATLVGFLEDKVVSEGFEVINDEEWSAWMQRHGATPASLQSAMVSGIYDYVFGYVDGDASRPSIEAGTAIHGVVRLLLTYKGAVFYEMQAGMGDIVFAPAYEVLKSRGVRFEFFRRVERLEAAVDGTRVERIVVRRQAEVKGGGEYQPLRRVRDVPSWPSAPNLDQLVDGDTLAGAEFESAWAPPTGTLSTLECGRDFDDVIVGISIGALKYICADLAPKGSAFERMLEQVQTVQTCSMQLWLCGDAASAGAYVPARTVSAYAQDLNTWSDMSFLLGRETWPDHGPQFLGYFCGQFADATQIPGFADHEFPARERERFRAAATRWLHDNTAGIWPKTCGPNGFEWPCLYDATNGHGESRLASQYLRVNIDPTERYVLSLPGTSKFRLRAGESGFSNLFLTGDWVRTSINAGCVEAAVMAGMDAAAALSGDPINIVGGLR